MHLFAEIVSRLLRAGVDQYMNGKMPVLVKGAFFGMIGVLCIMATNYLSLIESRFSVMPQIEASIFKMSESVVDLNGKMETVVERSNGQQKIQELHTQLLQGMERRLLRLEGTNH